MSAVHLERALEILSRVPDNFSMHAIVHRTISRRSQLLQKLKSGDTDGNVDRATAELLALHSQRGTFGQRHSIWHEVKNGGKHAAIPPSMQVVDSPSSELALVGFEYGISLASPDIMILMRSTVW